MNYQTENKISIFCGIMKIEVSIVNEKINNTRKNNNIL